MAKRKDIEDKSAAPSGDALTPSAIETKAIEPASEAPKLETPKVEAAPIALAKDELPAIEAPKLAAEAPKLTTGAPTVVREAPKVAEIKIAAEDKAAPTPLAAEASAPAVPVASARINRFALLAASVAIAAAIGAMSGALGASGLLWSAGPTQVAEAASTPTIVDETRALHGTLAQLRTDLAALKTSLDASTKGTNGQFAKIAERFDRVERAQTEPAAKLTKAIESLERLEKRVDPLTAREATGSVSPPQPTAANTQPPPTSIVAGWIVRDVYRGMAIIQGRGFGMIEVEPGDTVPGVGRVDAIRKQDGRWVVVTSKGLITSAR